MLELTPGAHQIKVSALQPSGFYTAWATNTFTNNIAYQMAADMYDAAGNITNRVWRNASGNISVNQRQKRLERYSFQRTNIFSQLFRSKYRFACHF